MANASISLTGISLVSKLDNFAYINTNWWQFFFEKDLPLDSFVTSDWYAFFFERGIYLEAIGRANKQLSGIESLSEISTVSAVGQNNATQIIDGIDLLSSFSAITVTVDDLQETNSIELISSIGEVNPIADSYYQESGISVITEFSEINAFGNANYQESGISIISSNSEVIAFADSLTELLGLDAIIDYGTISVIGTENASVVIGGISLISDFTLPNASAVNAVDAEIFVNGFELNSNIGNIKAQIENPQTYAGGAIQRYPANAFKNSTVKITGITANSSQNQVFAVGSVQINATITVDNVVSFTQIANVNAEGVLSINDEDLILLLAA